jgi:HSP20 family molecular chaperone IbpA
MSTSTSTSQNIATRSPETLAEQTEEKRYVAPPVDIFENAQELLLRADVPGAAKEDVSLHFEKDRLTLTATTPTIAYRREFMVAPGIDIERTEAKVQRGVLEVHLPKGKAMQTRQIRVLGE